jgi:hypothetical protein
VNEQPSPSTSDLLAPLLVPALRHHRSCAQRNPADSCEYSSLRGSSRQTIGPPASNTGQRLPDFQGLPAGANLWLWRRGVKNVVAANGCELVTRGKTEQARNSPRLFRDDRRARVAIPVRVVLRLARISEFLELDLDAALLAPVKDRRVVS